MNRVEFMNKLEKLLTGIPLDERGEALQYYTDYFEDAGSENEQQVIRELGSPEKVAATIKADIQGNGSSGQFTEQGYQDPRFEQKDSPAKKEDVSKEKGSGYTYQGAGYQSTYRSTHQSGYENGGGRDDIKDGQSCERKGGKILLILLLIFVAVPFGVPIALGAIALVIGMIFASFGLFAGLVFGSVILAAAGLLVFGFGLTKLMTIFPVALVTSGVGLVMFVVGVVAIVLTLKLCKLVYPAIFGFIIKICRWPFERRMVS